MCAKFGKDRSISFQVMSKKTKAFPTDGRSDGRTDKVTYRVACTRLKTLNTLNLAQLPRQGQGRHFRV